MVIKMKVDKSIPRRYIACLDVLGFKDALERDTHQLTQNYFSPVRIADLSHKATKFVPDNPGVKRIDGKPTEGKHVPEYPHIFDVAIFSDSIFIFTKDETPESLTELCEFSFLVYRDFLTYMLPLRGGIAGGEAVVLPEEKIYLGKGIVAAWQLEQSLDLTGIVLCPGLESPASAEAEVTFKGGHKETLRVPKYRSAIVTGEHHARDFHMIRRQAGPKYAHRYENSEPVVAAMLKIDRSLLRLPEQSMQAKNT